MIKVLIVEDSRVVSEYLEFILSSDPEINVIGNVSNGKAAIDFIRIQKPDVITMDINMPIMNGLEATRLIMCTDPIPIIIVSNSQNTKDRAITLEALETGALSVIEKPSGIGHPMEAEHARKLLSMVKLMAEIKVITRRPSKSLQLTKKNAPTIEGKSLHIEKPTNRKIVVVGVSSGGPQVLQKIFSSLTTKFPLPILVVQHIANGFLEGLVGWLDSSLSIPVQVAKQNETILSGHIYFAPNNYQMGIGSNGKIILSENQGQGGIFPSVAHLFSSVEMTFGAQSIAILLTGMGKDGATELRRLRDTGALTIAQDKESSMIYGMPGVAAELDAADYILNTDQIAELLVGMEDA